MTIYYNSNKYTISFDRILPERATVKDLNPHNKDYVDFMVIYTCDKCDRRLGGTIVLDRKSLTVADTSGFMFDEFVGDGKIICDDCDKRMKTTTE